MLERATETEQAQLETEVPAAAVSPETSVAEPAAEVQPQTATAPAPTAQPPIPQPAAPAAIPASPFAPPIGNLPPEVQAYVTDLQNRSRAAEEQAELQQLNQATGQYAALLEQRYQLTPEVAQLVAKEQADIVYKQYQANNLAKRQVRAAIAIAKQYGIDPSQLLDLPSDAAMYQTAQALSTGSRQSQEIAELKAQVQKLTKAAVPAQTFSQGAQPGAGAGLQGDALQSAWLKHEREQPDRPNPYDNAYRAMVNS